MASSRLEVDLGAIERNLAAIRRVVGGSTVPQTAASGGRCDPAATPRRSSICAVLKQDAYGAGSVRIAKRLAAAGVEMVAVYTLDEARALAENVPNIPILVLMPVSGIDRSDPLYRHAAAGRIHLTLHSVDQFASILEMVARIGLQVPVHVQVDTGLSRGGAMPEDAARLVQRIVASPRIRLGGLMTHFASPCCDELFTREQARLFREFLDIVRPILKAAIGSRHAESQAPLVHAANSCAMFRSHAYHGTMVRIGQALLGYCADDVPPDADFEFRQQMEDLRPSVRWVSSVVHTQEIPAGWPVGYGMTWRAPSRPDGRKSRVALIPIGYADGFPRTLAGGKGGGGWVGFTGLTFARRSDAEDAARIGAGAEPQPVIYAPVVGRVSMDQITVDVTDVPESYLRPSRAGGLESGPEVEIYSRSPGAPNYLPCAADEAGTITHDLLCRVSPRVERVYRSLAADGRPEHKPTVIVRPVAATSITPVRAA